MPPPYVLHLVRSWPEHALKVLKCTLGCAEGQSPQAPSLHSRGSADALAEDEDALRQAAWRWRFNRRWAQEQARGMDPDYGRQVRPPLLPRAAHIAQQARGLFISSCIAC